MDASLTVGTLQLGQRCVQLAAAVHPGSTAHVGAAIAVWQDACEAAAADTSGAGDALRIVAASNMADAVSCKARFVCVQCVHAACTSDLETLCIA